MFTIQRLTGRSQIAVCRANEMGLATCVAIDAGCMAASGLAGAVAFGFAWAVLKIGGVI